jgi:signal transduction histidine kinase
MSESDDSDLDSSHLSAINKELVEEIAARERTEIELTLLKDELTADLNTMIRLHELSTRLLASTELQPLLEEILDATIDLLHADFGTVQLCDPESRVLQLLVHRGFKQDFLDHFARVYEDSSVCGRAMRQGSRVIVEDVNTDPPFAPHRAIAASAGFRAVQSTPLFSRCGELLGMISTHFRQPHRPSEHELRFFDLYAHFAAEFIERQHILEARKQAEEQARKAYEQMDIVLGSISDNFFGLDNEGRFAYFNKHAAEQMRSLGKDPEKLIGKVVWEEFPDMPNYDNVVRVLKERVTIVDEFFFEPLGEWLENHMYPSIDGGLVIFQRYITERKQTEEELRRTQAELAHVTRLTTLGELMASIAHEINQPLGAIVTNGHACLRLLSREPHNVEEARKAVECMIADGIRASEVIKRIRRLVKKSSGGKSSHSVNGIIREVLSLTASELTKNEISVRTQLSVNLPYVIADRIQIQQVLLNLILNSKEAMSSTGWGPRELLIRSEQTGKEITVNIEDTGVGIPLENREQAFEPFFTCKEGGLGLGLSISRTIIQAHGGRLWMTPGRNDQGASFFFTLPISEDR